MTLCDDCKEAADLIAKWKSGESVEFVTKALVGLPPPLVDDDFVHREARKLHDLCKAKGKAFCGCQHREGKTTKERISTNQND